MRKTCPSARRREALLRAALNILTGEEYDGANCNLNWFQVDPDQVVQTMRSICDAMIRQITLILWEGSPPKPPNPLADRLKEILAHLKVANDELNRIREEYERARAPWQQEQTLLLTEQRMLKGLPDTRPLAVARRLPTRFAQG
jgi:hypothetical protein